jgi:predicted lysophospholipase L1 biosynthesis ABC-type transport system permease subunit
MIKRLALAALTLAVASCGSVSDLQPQAGKSLPQKPALAARALTADELLDLPTQADPRRVDELNKKGDVREPDRFDLPPPDGEAVPPPLAEPTTEQEPQT